MYNPKPIDLSDVVLPDELMEFVEVFAENTHDVWSQSRIASGWTYGEKRDDDLKTNPCLVPYSDLPESEKEYDRDTAINAVKLLLKLGYQISR